MSLPRGVGEIGQGGLGMGHGGEGTRHWALGIRCCQRSGAASAACANQGSADEHESRSSTGINTCPMPHPPCPHHLCACRRARGTIDNGHPRMPSAQCPVPLKWRRAGSARCKAPIRPRAAAWLREAAVGGDRRGGRVAELTTPENPTSGWWWFLPRPRLPEACAPAVRCG